MWLHTWFSGLCLPSKPVTLKSRYGETHCHLAWKFNSICKALDLVFADNDNTSWICWSSSSSIFGVMYCSSFFQSKINHSTALSSPGRYWMCHTERDNPRVGRWDTPLRGQLLTKFDSSYNLNKNNAANPHANLKQYNLFHPYGVNVHSTYWTGGQVKMLIAIVEPRIVILS